MLNIKNLQQNVIIAPYTTYKIGGPADYFLIAKTKEELVDAVREARSKGVPCFVLGTGANILMADKGFRGLVIKNNANKIKISGNIVTAESGATIAELINLTMENNLSGLEHFAGIPSTVGGAMWQNLHFLSPDRTKTMYIESVVKSAEILNTNNELEKVDRDFFKFGYDKSILHTEDLIVTEVTFELEMKDESAIRKQIDENLKWRNEKQPPVEEYPSCGSVFKKIDDVGAGRLIDKVGLKGHKIGGAEVSEKHANFIINTGGAKAQDVCDLISHIQNKVYKETGYKIETEINLVGEFN